MSKTTSLISDLLGRLDVERRYEFEERAGVIEFDSGTTRDEAEALALIDLLREHPGALLDVTALAVRRDGGTDTGPYSADATFTVVRSLNLAELIRSRFGGTALLAQI